MSYRSVIVRAMQQILRDMTARIAATVWQDGGQRRARRNAWRAMVDDTARARLREEAEDAVRAAQQRSAAFDEHAVSRG